MCKLKGQGKRCPVTPQRKEMESYRQKVKYQAKKDGKSSSEWLQTDDGKKFSHANNPKILNPNWEQEHQASLQKLHHEPQVTMNDDFLANANDASVLKANFLPRDMVRGQELNSSESINNYIERVSQSLPTFTSDEVRSLYKYSTSEYKKINNILRSAEGTGNRVYGDEREKLYQTITHVDSALAQRRKEVEITYRCTKSKQTVEQSLEEYKPNTVIKFDGYTSTSHSPAVAMDFSDFTPDIDEYDEMRVGNDSKSFEYLTDAYTPFESSIMFEVQSNAGQPIAKYTQLSDEREVLMPRGIYFKVVDSYAPDHENSYKIEQPASPFDDNGDTRVGEVKKRFVVVQLVECDKDGNIMSPNNQQPHHPANYR